MIHPQGLRHSGDATTSLRVQIWLKCLDGEWTSGLMSTPNAVLFGTTRAEALAAVQAFALRMLHDQVATGTLRLDESASITFELVGPPAPQHGQRRA